MLYGRDAERETLRQLLDGARASRSAALVLRGEAGVGKSALLADAVDQAGEMRVLRAVGVEAESELSYAGLHQLLRPVLGELAEIPRPQRRALESALGLSAPVDVDRFLVSVAALSLLAAAAEDQPTLAVVDDAQWLDTPSSDALAFVARRLHAERIALLFAARDDSRRFEGPGIAELTVSGLVDDAARALLDDAAAPDIPAAVREQLVEVAGGNPLALLELPRALTGDQRTGREPLGELPQVTSRLEAAFLARVDRLPEGTLRLLVLAAADDTGDSAVVLGAADRLSIEPADVEAAETSGLLRITERGVQFRHPLVRSAVYHAAGFALRRSAHVALAEVLDAERYGESRIWHRAATASSVDEELALELERSASRARVRSGYGAAASALERAAALTPEDGQRVRRLLAAAECAWLGGRPARASALLDGARRLAPSAELRADVDHLRGLIELQHGVPAKAHEILLAAEREMEACDTERAARLLVAAGEAAAFAGIAEGEIEAGRRADGLRHATGAPPFELDMMSGIGRLLLGDFGGGCALLRAAIAGSDASANPRRLFWAGGCALYLLDNATARGYFARAAEQARGGGEISMLALALQMLAHAELSEGRIASASANAAEALRLARETGQENSASHALAVLARTSAMSGRDDECRAHAGDVLTIAAARGLALQASLATWALGELDLGAGRPADAAVRYGRLAEPPAGQIHISFRVLTVPDRVEIAVRLDRSEAVRADLNDLEAWAAAARSQPGLALAARCRALLADGQEAYEHFEAALRLHSGAAAPFQEARTRLLYGETLRRARRRRDAREQIRVALETFDQLGAASWAERARAELRASGETARRRDPSTIDDLTAQELQIARFVAAGASNREVAEQLFLSPRTIDFHLRNVYAKLGIASRRDLAGLGLDEDLVTVPATPPVRI